MLVNADPSQPLTDAQRVLESAMIGNMLCDDQEYAAGEVVLETPADDVDVPESVTPGSTNITADNEMRYFIEAPHLHTSAADTKDAYGSADDTEDSHWFGDDGEGDYDPEADNGERHGFAGDAEDYEAKSEDDQLFAAKSGKVLVSAASISEHPSLAARTGDKYDVVASAQGGHGLVGDTEHNNHPEGKTVELLVPAADIGDNLDVVADSKEDHAFAGDSEFTHEHEYATKITHDDTKYQGGEHFEGKATEVLVPDAKSWKNPPFVVDAEDDHKTGNDNGFEANAEHAAPPVNARLSRVDMNSDDTASSWSESKLVGQNRLVFIVSLVVLIAALCITVSVAYLLLRYATKSGSNRR